MYTLEDESSKCDPTLYEVRGQEPEGLMVHTTDGVDSQGWLQGGSRTAGKPASVDFLIARSGRVIRLVPRGMMAYHAGKCLWNGAVDGNNETSRRLMGVELENADSQRQVPTLQQHEALAALTLGLASKYKWGPLRVYGHYGLAYPMGRRSDPHALDWGHVFWLMRFGGTLVGLKGQISL